MTRNLRVDAEYRYLFRYTEDTEGFTENRESTKSIYSFSLCVLCANSVISVSGLNRYNVFCTNECRPYDRLFRTTAKSLKRYCE